MRERISFFSSWYQTMKVLPEEQRLPFLAAILAYGFEGAAPCFADPMMQALWLNIQPVLDSSNARIDGGARGGRKTSQATLPSYLDKLPSQATLPSYLDKLPSQATLPSYLDKLPPQPSQATSASYPSMDKDKEIEKEVEKEKDEAPPSPCSGEAPQGEAESPEPKKESVKMKRPTLDEVRQYMCSCNLLMTPSDPDRFFDFFSSNGWKVSGRAPMKDWKAAARNWLRRNQPKPNPNAYNCAACPPPPPPPTPEHYD